MVARGLEQASEGKFVPSPRSKDDPKWLEEIEDSIAFKEKWTVEAATTSGNLRTRRLSGFLVLWAEQGRNYFDRNHSASIKIPRINEAQ